MRRFLFMLPLLAVLCAAAPAFAQSDALKEARQKYLALLAAGKFVEAEPWIKKALDLEQAEYGVDSIYYASSLTDLGTLYNMEGLRDKAAPLFQRALTITEKLSGSADSKSTESLESLGLNYLDQHRYAEAEDVYKRALTINEKALGPDDRSLATDLKRLAEIYEIQGRNAEAVPLDKRALAMAEKAYGPDDPEVAASLGDLASDYLRLGRYAEAEPLYKRALQIDEKALPPDAPDLATDLDSLAAFYRGQGRYAEAEPLARRALAINEKSLGPNSPYVAQSLDGLALDYKDQGRYTEALPLIRRAADIVSRQAASIKKKREVAQTTLRNWRYIFLDEMSVTTHLVSMGDKDSPHLIEDGFEALQWSKASDTAAAVSHMSARFALGNGALARLVRDRQDAQNQLDVTEAAILKTLSEPSTRRDAKAEAALRAEDGSLRGTLKKLDAQMPPRYAELVNPKPIAIVEVQRLLALDQALVVFAMGSKESYVAVVTHGSYEPYIAPVNAETMSAAVKQLRSSLDPDRFEPRKWSVAWLWNGMRRLIGLQPAPAIPPFEAGTAYTLYQQLLAPAEARLKGVRQLFVVTDGALESLPLGVLLTEKPASSQLAGSDLIGAAWLVKNYAVSVLPSVSSLKALKLFARDSRATKPFMGIGNPVLKPPTDGNRGVPVLARGVELRSVYRGAGVDQAALRDLPALPETADELNAEAEFLKAGPDSLLLGPAATVTAVMHADLKSRRVIAFATHGLLAGDVGAAEPGLVMTPPGNMTPPEEPTEENDGVLKASQIALLNLNADLVILSACNTAGPDGTPGAEGFSGLAKAFLYAGARTLVVSNWSVESTATTALMKNMQIETAAGVGHAEALRQAELALMNNPVYAHPLFWAPFVVVGEGGASPK